MLKSLKVYHIESANKADESADHAEKSFVLQTCQRHLHITTEDDLRPFDNSRVYSDEEAYKFLLEVICGLKSQLVGEFEIVAQFRKALQSYLDQDKKCPTIIRIIEKLLMDSKNIRTKYLQEICQKTYAAIVRKVLFKNQRPSEVLIFGSGALAIDVINQLKKKTNIIICARNHKKVEELAREHKIAIFPWSERLETHKYKNIVNTIGTHESLYSAEFLDQWLDSGGQYFIDLGSPSPLNSPLTTSHGLFRLHDILGQGVLKEQRKKEQISKAQDAIGDIVQLRKETLKRKKACHPKIQTKTTSKLVREKVSSH